MKDDHDGNFRHRVSIFLKIVVGAVFSEICSDDRPAGENEVVVPIEPRLALSSFICRIQWSPELPISGSDMINPTRQSRMGPFPTVSVARITNNANGLRPPCHCVPQA
jgi:hypothetical protein